MADLHDLFNGKTIVRSSKRLSVDVRVCCHYYALLQIPFAISNTVTERTVQKESQKITTCSSASQLTSAVNNDDVDAGEASPKPEVTSSKINLFYFQFWYFLCVFVTACAMFWVDLLPWFGTSSSWHVFTQRCISPLFLHSQTGHPVFIFCRQMQDEVRRTVHGGVD